LKVALCLRRAGGCSGVSDSIIVPTKISGDHPTLVSTAQDAMAGRLRPSTRPVSLVGTRSKLVTYRRGESEPRQGRRRHPHH
jgi:hypothetical protein